MENPTGENRPIDIEKRGKRELFEFDDDSSSSTERLSVVLTVKDDERFPNIPSNGSFVVSKKGKFLAEVRGELQQHRRDKAVEFRAVSSHNFTKYSAFTAHMPRVVGRTIAEVVTRGFVGGGIRIKAMH